MKFLQALRSVSSKLSALFEESKLFEHSGETGRIREEILAILLRPFLPQCFGLGTGQIFSLDGNTSKQIDIVIYDAIYSNALFKDSASSLFPCESVYGEIEIKSMLSSSELIKSMDNIASMKRLNRQDSTMLDLSPISHLSIGDGLKASDKKLNPYMGVIFGFDGVSLQTLLALLNDELVKRDKFEMPDFLFCHKQGYMVMKVKGSSPVPLGGEFDKYSFIRTADDTIPLMFVTLNTCLNQIKLKAPDYNQYWINLLKEVINNSKS